MPFGFINQIIASLKDNLCERSNYRFIFFIEINHQRDYYLIGCPEDGTNNINSFALIEKLAENINNVEYLNSCIKGARFYFASNIDRCLQESEDINFIKGCKNQFNIDNKELWRLAKKIGFLSEDDLKIILSDLSDETYGNFLLQIENYRNIYI